MPVLASFLGCVLRRKMHGLRSRIYNQLFVIPHVQRRPFWSSWTRRIIFQIRPCYFQFARWQLGSGWFGGEMSGTSSTSTYLLITRREWGMSGRDLSYKLASHPSKICKFESIQVELSCFSVCRFQFQPRECEHAREVSSTCAAIQDTSKAYINLEVCVHLTCANVWKSVGNPCSYMQFNIFATWVYLYQYCKSHKNLYQILQVMCTTSECATKSMIKSLSS